MPSTVADMFAAVGLAPGVAVRWGTPVPEPGPGNYVVALTEDPDSMQGVLVRAPLESNRLAYLLDIRPELRLDGRRPTVGELAGRLEGFWLPDEVVVYAGLAGTSVRQRVGQYYKTPLGARRPHAGGWWLKTLGVLNEMWVHYATTPDDAEAEAAMLRHFAARVSSSSRDRLYDSGNRAPFANLRTGRGDNKRHGISGATGDLGDGPGMASTGEAHPWKPDGGLPRPSQTSPSRFAPVDRRLGAAESQNVTAKDLEAGRLRFPRPANLLFPPGRAYVDVVLRGHEFQAVRWDARAGPGKERSGLLAFGKGKLNALVTVGETLTVTASPFGKVELH